MGKFIYNASYLTQYVHTGQKINGICEELVRFVSTCVLKSVKVRVLL